MFKAMVIILLISNIILGFFVFRLYRRADFIVAFNDAKKNQHQDSVLALQHRDISLLQAQVHRVASVLWNQLNLVPIKNKYGDIKYINDMKSQRILRPIIIMFADTAATRLIQPGKKLIYEENGGGF